MPFIIDENGEVIGGMAKEPTQPTPKEFPMVGKVSADYEANPLSGSAGGNAGGGYPVTPIVATDPYSKYSSYAGDAFNNPNLYTSEMVPVIKTKPDGTSFVGLEPNPNYPIGGHAGYGVGQSPIGKSVASAGGYSVVPVASDPFVGVPGYNPTNSQYDSYITPVSRPPSSTTPSTAPGVYDPNSKSDTLRTRPNRYDVTSESGKTSNPFPAGTREANAYDEYNRVLWDLDSKVKAQRGTGLSAAEQMDLWINTQERVRVYQPDTVGADALESLKMFLDKNPSANGATISKVWDTAIKEANKYAEPRYDSRGNRVYGVNGIDAHAKLKKVGTYPGYAMGSTFVVGERRPELVNVQPSGNQAQITVTPLARTSNGYRLDPNSPSQQRAIPRMVEGYRLPGYAYGDRFRTEEDQYYPFGYGNLNYAPRPQPETTTVSKYEIYPLRYRGQLAV